MPKIVIRFNLALLVFVLGYPASADISIIFDKEKPENQVFTKDIVSTIQKIADTVDKDVRHYFPDLEKKIFLELETGPYVIEETGEVGGAIDRNRISWTVDPARPEGIKAIAEKYLRGTLFHEFHHLARGWARLVVEPPIRIIDAAISEGLSVAFQRDYAGTPHPWETYPPEIDQWVQEIIQDAHISEYHKWMFRHPDGRRLIGYKVGTYLVDKAIHNTNKTSVDLVDASTDEILEFAFKKK